MTEPSDGPGSSGSSSAPLDLAAKLERLFTVIHPPERGPYSNREVAAAIRDRYQVSISDNYLSMLRAGHRTNPTLRHVQALARFFGVDPNYFFDTDEAIKIDEQLDVIAAMRDNGVRNLALRASQVSSATRQGVQALLDNLALDRRRHGQEDQ
jgi:transcriptional regulator with XRE-family HTH domain